jgi:hypothetical protein
MRVIVIYKGGAVQGWWLRGGVHAHWFIERLRSAGHYVRVCER